MTTDELSDQEFEKLVAEGLAALPDWIRERMDNVAVVMADNPSSGQRRQMKLRSDHLLLGLYHGVPLTARGVGYSAEPDKITLFKKPITKVAGRDRLKIRQLVKDTVWHEVAHHFGMTEAEVADREKDRR